MSKKNGPSYLRRKERRAQERKEKREAKTLHETEIIDRKNDFKTRLVVALQKPARIERPEEKIDIERLDIDHNFANKIKELTNDFSTNMPLQDAMIMYSNNKNASKFNIQEFERYQTLTRRLSKLLKQYKGNYSKAYEALLNERTGLEMGSVERKIIELYYKNLNKDSIDR